MQIAHPTQRQQQQRDHMMNEHLPEVLALNVAELRHRQRPVERHGNHVIPPDVIVHRLVRIAVPAMLHIPEPRFIPQHNAAVHETVRVVDAAP